ncbi:spike base protein, RCAP_Rcc01079 family [Brevundimonas aurifodinae]|uniref:Uncharacterized protein n=2 Tax=Brevundimonas TaxID=41275 RepID=A0ABV1NMR2_9CAUL|nr:MAG: hypothetical protein B7Z42_04890 [Brevundimonas sp. 12-68-7]OYX36132.1 MAG: hypothetical protein B7Z01_00305 [Brevundimonas subvibrioides]
MSIDTYAAFAASPSAPARRLQAVTPADGADLPSLAKALFIGAAGDLRIVPVASLDGEAVTLKNHPIGYVAVQTRRVMATGTTAAHIVALFD